MDLNLLTNTELNDKLVKLEANFEEAKKHMAEYFKLMTEYSKEYELVNNILSKRNGKNGK